MPQSMPWHCPACHAEIRHNELDPKPRPGERYRCHICRLELVLDPATDKLAVTMARTERDPKQRP
jgi:hypothetical protein